MPIVSGFVFSKMNPTSHIGNIRLFEPVIFLTHNHDYDGGNHEDANRKEEPEEPLYIATEIAAIIFLVAFTNFLPFIGKHRIDLKDMLLHLSSHPLLLLVFSSR